MTDYTQIKESLLARRGELEQRLAKIKDDLSQPLDHDFAEQAVELENDEVLGTLGIECEEEVKKINRALIRIEEGSYGECVDCGKDISPGRLAVRPYSSRCIQCAEKKEQ